ncbi:YMGG-like glycine zipper-containing protein [Roseococcus sp. YIM B11640]|uniref:YMGG-like glycine zipper-containing protein n=1 Tax=Roseococcus sp. YIM B11640 TaxID=3133973 RepID=UPI003C7B12FF
MSRRPLHRATAALTASLMLAGCVTTQTGRIGADDGRDVCRQQLVALDSTGDFYGEDILTGAAVGALGGALVGGLASGNWQGALIGAAVGGATGAAVGYYTALQRQARDQQAIFAQMSSDLARENAQLDRTQIAWDQLMDCRLSVAQRVREAVKSGRLDRQTGLAQMAEIRARVQNDIQVAQRINASIGQRGAQFDTAIENTIPGGKNAVVASYRPPAAARATVRRAVAVKFRPDAGSAEIAQINARDVVSVRPGPAGYAQVETSSGVRGYVPNDALQGAPRQQAAAPPSGGDVRSLAATNISRRDNFSESVSNAERLAQAGGGGFELAS